MSPCGTQAEMPVLAWATHTASLLPGLSVLSGTSLFLDGQSVSGTLCQRVFSGSNPASKDIQHPQLPHSASWAE
jgi:hypothetical protein